MSKIIKPLLDENGMQVRRRLSKGDWFYIESLDKYECWTLNGISLMNTCIYYAEKWKPYENDKYYYYNVYFCEAISTYYVEDSLFHQINIETGNCFRTREEAEQADIQQIVEDSLFHQINIETGNCFRTREEAEQADIQQILDNLKEYYKNKQQEGK